MNQITDAVLLTSSMKILNRKARYIKEKLNLTEINIDWKVLEEKIYFSQKSYQSPIVLVLMSTLDGNTKTLLPVSELPCILSLIQ